MWKRILVSVLLCSPLLDLVAGGIKLKKPKVPGPQQIGNAARRTVGNVGKTLEKGVQDAGHTVEKAAQDTGRTVEKAVQDVGHTVEKAAQDTGHTIEKAGNDVVEQGKRSINDTTEALKATRAYVEACGTSYVRVASNAWNRIQQGKALDAAWGALTEPYKYQEAAAFEAAHRSKIVAAAGQVAASTYGGPAGAAAYASWLTYRETGDADLALRVGVVAGASSLAFRQIDKIPSVGSGIAKRAVLNGATAGLSVAALKGDPSDVRKSIKMAVAMSLGRDAYRSFTRHDLSTKAASKDPLVYREGVEPDPFIRDENGNILDPEGRIVTQNEKSEWITPSGEKSRPLVDVFNTDPAAQHVGQMNYGGPVTMAQEPHTFMRVVSQIPGMNGMGYLHDGLGLDGWTNVTTIAPATYFTYMSTSAPTEEAIRRAGENTKER